MSDINTDEITKETGKDITDIKKKELSENVDTSSHYSTVRSEIMQEIQTSGQFQLKALKKEQFLSKALQVLGECHLRYKMKEHETEDEYMDIPLDDEEGVNFMRGNVSEQFKAEDSSLKPSDSKEQENVENIEIESVSKVGNKPRINLKKQSAKKHGETKAQCDVCAKTFIARAGLVIHMKTHKKAATEIPKHFNCSTCGESFAGLKLLSNHKNEEHMKFKREDDASSTQFCDKCGVTFSSRQSLKHHVIVIHTKAFPQHCDNCGKGFTNTGLGEKLENHKKSCSTGA